MANGPDAFINFEPRIYDLLTRTVAQWRSAGVSERSVINLRCQFLSNAVDQAWLEIPAPNTDTYASAYERLTEVLMEVSVLGHGDSASCRLHMPVRAQSIASLVMQAWPDPDVYTRLLVARASFCGLLAAVGVALVEEHYGLERLPPTPPGVFSSGVESNRRHH